MDDVWGIGYIDDLVLRDRDADANSGTGNLGKSGSGLEERLYAQQDANHNITALVDTSGDVQQRFIYDPYGVSTVLAANWTGTTDAFNWHYRHQGTRWIEQAGLYDVRNRFYSPTLMRWMQEDPAGYVDGGNLYKAFSNSPTHRADPTGLASTISKPGKAVVLKDATLTLPNGDVGTVSMATGGEITDIGADGAPISAAKDLVLLTFKKAAGAKTNCDDLHWIQFVRNDFSIPFNGREVKAPVKPYNFGTNKAPDGKAYAYVREPGTTYVDTLYPTTPYYDEGGGVTVRPASGSEFTIGDGPSSKTELNVKQVTTIDAFLVANGSVVYHIQWTRTFTRQDGKDLGFSDALTSSGKTNSLGSFKTVKDIGIDPLNDMKPATVSHNIK